MPSPFNFTSSLDKVANEHGEQMTYSWPVKSTDLKSSEACSGVRSRPVFERTNARKCILLLPVSLSSIPYRGFAVSVPSPSPWAVPSPAPTPAAQQHQCQDVPNQKRLPTKAPKVIIHSHQPSDAIAFYGYGSNGP